MTPTRPRLLLVLAALAAAIGFATVLLWDSLTGRTLPVPLTAALTLVLLAVALFVWALAMRPRLLGLPNTRPVSPFVATRTAALAMAASRTGAIVALACVSAALLVTLAAVWLEYLCRLTKNHDDEPPAVPGDSDGDWVLPSTQPRR